jgi:hypothetical protein
MDGKDQYRPVNWYNEYREQKQLCELLWAGLLRMPHNAGKEYVQELMRSYLYKMDELYNEKWGNEE